MSHYEAVLIIISYEVRANSELYYSIMSAATIISHIIYFYYYINNSKYFHVLFHFVHFKSVL